MLIEPRPATDAELAALVTAQQRELREREAGAAARPSPKYAVRDGAEYLVAVVDGEAVACGALQRIDEHTAEVKRMYVRPDHRGQGISRRVLAALEELAAGAGYPTLLVEIGDFLPPATSLYETSGYHRIPPFGRYACSPHSVCFEKRIPARVR